MNNKKDTGKFIANLAKDIVDNKIHGYGKSSILREKINQKVDDIIELTKDLSPHSYQDILDSFYEANDENIESENQVNHPTHYGGKDNPYEVIKVLEAWGLDFHLGNAIKYISRAGKKDKDKEVQDLKKALWYINRKINSIEREMK